MVLQGAQRTPDGLTALRGAITQAYFPFEITEIAESEPINCGVESKNFGQLQFSHIKSSAPYRGRRRRDGRQADTFVLHLMEEGSVSFSQRRNSITAQAGALVLINPDPVLDTEKLSATKAIAVPIPAQLLTMYFPDARNWDLSMRASTFGSAAVLRDILESSWRQRDMIHAAEAVHLSKALIQLIGATFGDASAELPACGSRSMQLHYMRIRDVVIQNLENEDLSADFVTARLGISKSYLFAILKKADTTLGRLILQQRLERCREMLIDPAVSQVSISEIAYSVGFRELPHFSRCFTKQYGESPRAFRTAQRQKAAALS